LNRTSAFRRSCQCINQFYRALDLQKDWYQFFDGLAKSLKVKSGNLSTSLAQGIVSSTEVVFGAQAESETPSSKQRFVTVQFFYCTQNLGRQ